jgi:hypothetical protein
MILPQYIINIICSQLKPKNIKIFAFVNKNTKNKVDNYTFNFVLKKIKNPFSIINHQQNNDKWIGENYYFYKGFDKNFIDYPVKCHYCEYICPSDVTTQIFCYNCGFDDDICHDCLKDLIEKDNFCKKCFKDIKKFSVSNKFINEHDNNFNIEAFIEYINKKDWIEKIYDNWYDKGIWKTWWSCSKHNRLCEYHKIK